MKIKKINTKKIKPILVFIVGFIIGLAAMYGITYPNLMFFKNAYNFQKNAYNQVTNYTCTQKDLDAFLQEYNTTNSPYRWYLTGTASLACRSGFKAYHTYEEGLPTPTPQVKYNTQTKVIYVGCPPNFTLVNGRCVNAYGL